MIDSPSGGAPEKAPRWDLLGTEGCGGGNKVSGAPGWFRAIWVYIGGRSRSVELRGAHEGGGAPTPWARLPASWPPRCFLDVHSKSPRPRLFHKSRSRRFHSVWISFDIPFLRKIEIGKKNSNFHLVNRLVPKII